ncbi:MAG: hypothetical protein UU24_C0004G0025 [Candidatus Nomurabacteria bacterium GW2011_GWA2_40_9]|uniref:Uncharacterized protein n=1 Tax=Candidatus Nomurabacteria bacterium GW2011_GWA2_40_9 TaxID=1618734 RepID=A0A0G0WWD3_9BACT|nr:MAG: hypothetical protein UU24_C0004G0025 [Candidatus Nomurabacteria bacterium GW2011_GWA2_40_9]
MEPNKKSNGALVGTIVIIIILVLGGIYMWNSKKANEAVPVNSELNEVENGAAAIQADLELIGTELDGADTNVSGEMDTVE